MTNRSMKMLLLVQHIIISIVLLWSRNSRAASADLELAPPVAKSNCIAHCGSVSIPYPFRPFGIGPNSSCYFDEWFQIDCNNSITPILRRSKLEVLNISIGYPYNLRVKNPVTFFNCKGKEVRQAANLTGSPFVYSQEDNKFVAVSCDFLASVTTDHDVIGSCSSKCVSSSDRDYDGCDIGINCCRITIPPYLTVINSSIQELAVDGGSRTPAGCDQYAFLVDQEWFDHENSKSTFRAVQKMESVPVVLEWSLGLDNNKSLIKVYEQFILDPERIAQFPFNNDSRPYCDITNATLTYKTGSKVECSCRMGFEGNAFLLQPCGDIDECKVLERCIPDSPLWGDAWNISNAKCENIAGGHICSDSTTGATCVLMAVGGGANCYFRSRRSDHQNMPLFSGLGSSLGVFLLLICAWWAHKYVTKRKDVKRKEMFFKRNGGLLLEQQISSGKVNIEKIKLFNSSELEKSTDNFSIDRVLGQGGQGTVFKGMLADGTIVAVKKSKIDNEGKVSEFINEVVILSQINHRNIVQLFGCCLETEVPLLVYEFIPNGTLSQYIQEQSEEFPLTWEVRLRIATEIAGALSYLHVAASCPIYHRDIKSANILLDEKYRAKIADFGTSRSVDIDQTHLTTNVYGTFGYLDPEYFQSSQFTEKSDMMYTVLEWFLLSS